MDGSLLLSDSRLELLAAKLDILEDSPAATAAAFRRAGFKTLRYMVPKVVKEAARPDPCAWNLLLRRRYTTSAGYGSRSKEKVFSCQRLTTDDLMS